MGCDTADKGRFLKGRDRVAQSAEVKSLAHRAANHFNECMKALLRKQIKQSLVEMSPRSAAAKSRAACEALLATNEYQRADVIMLFIPIPLEVDAEPLAHAAWDAGKTVLAPRVNWQPPNMIAREIRSMDELVPQRFSLREPVEGEPFPPGKIDLVLVPALAYDNRGNRLGRGGGFYDRFLSHPDLHAVTCGLAFCEQVVSEVPVESNDLPVEMIVTDAGVVRFNDNDHKINWERKAVANDGTVKET